MTKEQIIKCLEFAEGVKGKFTILMVKGEAFPETLIIGTPKQAVINDRMSKVALSESLVREGDARQIKVERMKTVAAELGCDYNTVREHVRNYERGVAFYSEWNEFWGFISDVRNTPVSEALSDILTDEDVSKWNQYGIVTVGDFLGLTVTYSATKLFNLPWLAVNAARKHEIFERIQEMCFNLL